jgi:undecaprenyl phosphate-alpha-L-ara4FN deformylase
VRGEPIDVPQFPTTLPTLDELIGTDRITEKNVADHMLALTGRDAQSGRDNVYTLHAELEGLALLDTMEALIIGWRAQGYTLCALRDLAGANDARTLPRHEIRWAEIPGRSGTLVTQGPLYA